MDFIGAFQRFPIWKVYRVRIYYSDILKLRTYD